MKQNNSVRLIIKKWAKAQSADTAIHFALNCTLYNLERNIKNFIKNNYRKKGEMK